MNQSPLNKNRQDKFILVLNLPEGIKNITDNGNGWMLINSVHGFSKYQFLNSGDPFVTGTYISSSATGFSFTGGPGISNESAKNYIYYAHA